MPACQLTLHLQTRLRHCWLPFSFLHGGVVTKHMLWILLLCMLHFSVQLLWLWALHDNARSLLKLSLQCHFQTFLSRCFWKGLATWSTNLQTKYQLYFVHKNVQYFARCSVNKYNSAFLENGALLWGRVQFIYSRCRTNDVDKSCSFESGKQPVFIEPAVLWALACSHFSLFTSKFTRA